MAKAKQTRSTVTRGTIMKLLSKSPGSAALLPLLEKALVVSDAAEDAETKKGICFGRRAKRADAVLEGVEQFIMANKAVSIEDAATHSLLALFCLDRVHDYGVDEPLSAERTEMARRLLFSIVDAMRAAGILRATDRLVARMGARWRSPWLTPKEANRMWRSDCFKSEAEAQAMIDRVWRGRDGPYG